MYACPPLAHYYQVRPRGSPVGWCPVCEAEGPVWVPCFDCQDFGTLFVPSDAEPQELLEDPMPLAWLSQVVALHCHQEVEPHLAHAHFAILLAALMAQDEETPSAPIYLGPGDYLVEHPPE